MLEVNSAKDTSSAPNHLPPFFPATLWSPGEVQTALTQEPLALRKRFKGSWYLCGDVSKEMYSALAEQSRQELAFRVFGTESPVGARYGIVCHQIRAFVHRFLLPLYEPRVGDFLLAMRGGRLGIQLGRDGSEQAAMLTAQMPMEPELVPLVNLATPLPRELARLAIAELPAVIAEMRQLSRFDVGPEPAHDVSLSVVLPTQTLQTCLADRLRK